MSECELVDQCSWSKILFRNGGVSLAAWFLDGLLARELSSRWRGRKSSTHEVLGTVKEIATRDDARKVLKGMFATLPADLLRCSGREISKGGAWCVPAQTRRTADLECAPAAIPVSFRFGLESFES
jgi:hypothetical protein